MDQEIDFQPIDFQPEGQQADSFLRGLYRNAVDDVSGIAGSLDPRNWGGMMQAKQSADADLAQQAKHPEAPAYELPGDRLAAQLQQIPGVLYQHPVQSALTAAPFAKAGMSAVGEAAPSVMSGAKAVAANPVVRAGVGTAANMATGGKYSAVKALMDLMGRTAKQPEAAPVPPAPPSAAAPVAAASGPSDVMMSELMKRIQNPDWRTQDVVPINARQTKGIIEPGESRVGLSERAAAAAKTDPAEAERLLKALRQRMHISEKAGR